MLCCSRMSLEHTTENMASLSGPFIKWFSRKTIKSIGVNISERKRGTERTKKRKKLELVIFSPPEIATSTVVGLPTSSRRYTDFARAAITRDIFITDPTQPGLSLSLINRQNTQFYNILQSELALPSTGSWLPIRLSST